MKYLYHLKTVKPSKMVFDSFATVKNADFQHLCCKEINK